MAKEVVKIGDEIYTKREIFLPETGAPIANASIGIVVKIDKTREGYWWAPCHDGGPFVMLRRNEFRTKKESEAYLKRLVPGYGKKS